MGRERKNSKQIDVETASTKEIADVVSSKLRDYGMVEYLLAMPDALTLLKKELAVLVEIENKLDASLLRLSSKEASIANKLLLGTIQTTAFDLGIVGEKLKAVTKVLPQKIEGYEKFASLLKAEPGLGGMLEKLSQSRRKGDAALNGALSALSTSLGGPTAVERMFKRFPELIPSFLPPSFNVDSIRKRIERHKRKSSTKS